ncbi:TetR/AcrR family transcriptional regulator [Limosilactobacillus kribbianus]|uniref:TetR/AcrR family transcriptional regulator n=1 Tax=Limosilactobacillus kribbianus TaxID=2982695 RepID=UPI0022647DBD|nr:TetR/AcrR family transcriptional regulator [Limosilactobacillus kribbianus]
MTLQEDMRVRRTKQNIINAFIALTKEKDIDAITVQEIAEKAMVNRATFYAHYHDKQDLYNQIFNQAIGLFTPLRNPLLFLNRKVMLTKLEKTLTKVLEDCAANRDILLLIIDGTPSRTLQQQLKPVLAANISGVLKQFGIDQESHIPLDLVITYILAIFTNVLSWWLHDGPDHQIDARQLAHMFVELALYGHMHVLGLNPE